MCIRDQSLPYFSAEMGGSGSSTQMRPAVADGEQHTGAEMLERTPMMMCSVVIDQCCRKAEL